MVLHSCVLAQLYAPARPSPPRAAAGYGLAELMSHVRWDNGPQGNSSENRTYRRFR
jgi:hypothetical protein